jgi:hypothetical protein
LQIIVQSMKNNEKKLENEKFRFKTSKKNWLRATFTQMVNGGTLNIVKFEAVG